jgi:aminopeptidase N
MRTLYFHIFLIVLLFLNNTFVFSQDHRFLQDNQNLLMREKRILNYPAKLPQVSSLNNYDLKYHRFNLIVDPAQCYISGSVTSYFVVTRDHTHSIQFQLNSSLSADSVLFEGNITSVIHTGNVITIPLNPCLSSGKLDSITIYYHGVPESSGFGSYGNYVHNGAASMWTLSEPYGASDWWPSKNDLTDKIDSIDVFVIVPKGNHVASNGLLISETPYDSISTLVHWKHRYPIASYLIAIAVTNYARYSDYYNTGTESFEILNYVYPEDSVAIRGVTPDEISSIALFEQLFTPYPFKNEKYGHAECNFDGGMEHQTMTFLGRNDFNHFTMAHELGHQWFGDMVTCGSWQDIWLNEGFATYCLYLTYEYLENDNSSKIYLKNLWSNIVSNPQGSVFCNDTTSVSRIFNSTLSYYKGAYVLHMLRWVLGDRDFFQGIRNYLNDPKLKYGFARTCDLKKHLEDQSGKDLTGFFAEWYYGTGVPDYNIQFKQQPDLNTLITINQTQYNSNVSFFAMPVPVEFKGANKDTTIVFNHMYSGQTFYFNPGFKIDSVFFDPDRHILHYDFQLILNQNVVEEKFIIMPDPTSKFLEVQHKSGIIKQIRILNMEGKQVFAVPTKQEDSLLKLNIQNLTPGVYILRIGTSDWNETKKFIVTK